MKILKHLFLSALLAGSLPGVVRAQTNSIETDANLKDTTTHVVVERKVIETTKTYQQDTPRDVQRKIAIIVQNRGSAALNDKVPVLEDLVSSRVAGKGFTVLSRDDVTRSLKDYSTGKDPNGELGALDRSLEDNSSALRLAQNLGADYILVPSIVSLGTEKKNYSGNGINTLNITHRLRVTYKIVEAGQGGAVRGGAFTSEKTLRQTPDLQTDSNDVINDLLDDAAEQLADAIVKNATSLPAEVAKAAMVNFNVSCSMTDPRQQPILISALGITADNHVVLTNQPIAVQAMDVTVELDGVALGSAPGSFQGRPGLHKIRLSREGFDPWERTVNIYEGQNLRVALQMSNAGYARWADTTAFLATLDANRKLTDAEVKRIEGIAEFFKNSHYRVDTKENIKIYKSLY
ncbi:MAG: PEGA domain-containing protein [Verrucomicrobiia bacterium]